MWVVGVDWIGLDWIRLEGCKDGRNFNGTGAFFSFLVLFLVVVALIGFACWSVEYGAWRMGRGV